MSELLYGINPVREALQGVGRKPLEVFVTKNDNNQRVQEILDVSLSQGLKVNSVSPAELERLAGHSRHQGVLLKLTPFQFTEFDTLLSRAQEASRAAFFLLLDGITDPHNFGAILRSAEIAGCHGVIVAKDRSCPVTSVVEKTAAGALSHLSLCRVTNLARTIDELKKCGIWCYGLAGEDGAEDLFQSNLKGGVALIVGSEGKGIRPNIRNHCDGLLSIPMQGKVSSLNASVATGIALFEVVRQHKDGS